MYICITHAAGHAHAQTAEQTGAWQGTCTAPCTASCADILKCASLCDTHCYRAHPKMCKAGSFIAQWSVVLVGKKLYNFCPLSTWWSRIVSPLPPTSGDILLPPHRYGTATIARYRVRFYCYSNCWYLHGNIWGPIGTQTLIKCLLEPPLPPKHSKFSFIALF